MIDASQLAEGRARTKELLLRSLHRADRRQQRVAKQRVAIRSALRMTRNLGASAFVVVLGLWGAIEAGYMPAFEIRPIERRSASKGSAEQAIRVVPPVQRAALSLPQERELPSLEDVYPPSERVPLKLEMQFNSLNP